MTSNRTDVDRRRAGPRSGWLVAAALAALLTACGGGDSATAHFEKAVEHQKAGDLRAAVIELKNALQRDPKLAKARWMLGRIYLAAGEAAAARKEIERARDAGLKDPALPRALAQAMILQGAFNDVLKLVDGVDGANTDPDWLALRGDALLGLGRTEAAKEAYSQAIELRPDHAEARRGLARVNIASGHLEAAREEVDQALGDGGDSKKGKGDLQTWLLKGELELAMKHVDAAEAAFRKAVEISSTSGAAHLGLARTYLAQRKPNDAEREIDAVAGKDSKDPRVNYLRALVARQRNDLGAARDALRAVLAVAPDHGPSLLLMGQIQYLQRNFEQAAESLSRYLTRSPGNVAARKLLGAVQIELGQNDKAIATLARAESAAPDDTQVLSLLGTAYLRSGQTDKGNDYLQRAANLAPDAAPIRTQLAVGKLVKGEQSGAVADLEAAIEADPKFSRADFLLVLAHLKAREFDAALAAAKRLAEKEPDSPQAHNLVGAALEASGDLAGARKSYEHAAKLDASFAPAALNIARLDLREGHADAARAGFEDVLKKSPDNPAALVALARIDSDQGKTEHAVELLEQAREKNPNAVQPRVILAGYYLRQREVAKALEVAREASKVSPNHPAVELLLGRALLASGATAEAEQTLGALVERYPDSAEARFQLSLAKAQAGDVEGARAGLEKVLEAVPDNSVAKATLARLELRAGRPERTAELATELQRSLPKAPVGWILAGDAAAVNGDLAAAEKAYRTALDKAPATAPLLRLVGVMRREGRSDDAQKRLEQWLGKHPDDAAARLVLASELHQSGKKDDAVKNYEEVIKEQPDNAVALNNLAWLYSERGDARALDYARRAYERFGERAEIVDTYGWLLVDSGQVEQGLALLEKAAKGAPDNGDIQYHLAAALVRAGDRDRARTELERLLGGEHKFTERAKAEALLQKLR